VKTNANKNGIKVINPTLINVPAKGQCMFFHNNPMESTKRTRLEENPINRINGI